MARHLLLAVALFLIVLGEGCAREPEQLTARDRYWSREVREFLSSPRSLDDLHSWLREHQVYYTFDDSNVVNGHWVAGLETIYPDTLFCEFWRFTLDVTVDEAREIAGYSLARVGACWYDANRVVPIA